MNNRQIMLSALKKKVIASLLEQGFVGKYPSFSREKEDCIEFIGFQANKYGGSFTVEVSAIFPDAKNKNYSSEYEKEPEDVWCTENRYRLEGMFDGWFYYSDVYLILNKFYENIGEKEAETFVPPESYKLVQKFTTEVADEICDEINAQMKKAFCWLEKFEKNNDKVTYKCIQRVKSRFGLR